MRMEALGHGMVAPAGGANLPGLALLSVDARRAENHNGRQATPGPGRLRRWRWQKRNRAGWERWWWRPGSAALLLAAGAAGAAPPKTIEPGKLNVALNGDMPMTGLKDGKLIGTDGDLMVLIAERLGLEVVPHMMEWSAEIQSTKQGKVDIMHGAMGWIEPRSEIMLLTDPIYYFGTFLAQKTDTNWSTFADMKGQTGSPP